MPAPSSIKHVVIIVKENHSDIPYYWSYANQLTLCDNYFTGTSSNHRYSARVVGLTSPSGRPK